MPVSRWRRLLSLGVVLALLLGACGTDDDGDGAATPGPRDDEAPDLGDPQYGGQLVVGLESETNSYLPGEWAGTQAGINVAYAIFDPLVRRDRDGQLRPYLAESLEPNDDLDEWTLTLREGVRFHDGTPLDADALLYNFDNLLIVEGATTRGALRDVEGMEVLDERTVRYRLSRANAAFPDLLTGPIGWPFSPAAHQELGPDAGANPVGTGPFRFVSWERDSQLVVERNDDYWQEGLPYLDRIVFRPIPDEETRAASFQAGDIDATHSVRLSEMIARFRALDGAVMYERPGNSGSGAIINTEVPPVDDVRVRRALALALDQQALIDVIAGDGVATPRTHWYTEDSPWYSERAAEAWPTGDPEAAREVLQDYIDDPNRSDGRPPGSPVAIDFNCTAIPSLQEQAQAYQAFWQAVGFEVTLHAVEQAAHIQNAIAGDYMVSCWRQGADTDPYTHLHAAFGPQAEIPTNFTNFEHPVILEQLDVLRRTIDFDERFEAIETIMLVLAEEVPYLWTGGNNEFVATRPGIGGIDDWRFPDGTEGEGAAGGIVMWGQVWIAG